MWALECINNGTTFYLKSNKLIAVGRSADICELLISGDTSVSRKHCSINVSESNVTITDHESRYGTYINDSINKNQKILPNIEVVMAVGDNIRFGILTNIWRLVRHSFVTSTSKLNVVMKSTLHTQLEALQGSLVEDWSEECTFLTMTKITLTHKVVMALVSNAYIVAPEFWSACIEASNTNTAIPNPNDYLPKVLESTLNQEMVDFLPNKKRKTLFKNKKVIFFSRTQKQVYERAITSAGGTCSALGESKLTKSALCLQDVIVIQYLSKSNSQESQVNLDNIKNIVNYIGSKGKRLIPETEIGLAVLYCSLEKYCNPGFDFLKQVCVNTLIKIEVPTEPKVLAVETQELHKSEIPLSAKVINASFPHIKDDMDISAPAEEKSILSETTSGSKRKMPDESPSTSSDSKKIKCVNTPMNMFNFIEELPEVGREGKSNKEVKTLNLVLPKKRTRNVENNEDNLFKFECDPEAQSSPKRNKLDTFPLDTSGKAESKNKVNKQEETMKQYKNLYVQKSILNTSTPWLSKINHSTEIKQEKDEVDNIEQNGLDSKLSSLNLGHTIIMINDGLMAKKENMAGETIQAHGPNFKKFQKIKPLRPQQTVIPKSAMVVYKPDVSNVYNLTASDDEESENDDISVSMNRKIIANKSNIRSRRL